jgi:hypothetical protein
MWDNFYRVANLMFYLKNDWWEEFGGYLDF